MFKKDQAGIPEEKRVRIFLRRLGTAEHRKLKSSIRTEAGYSQIRGNSVRPLRAVWRKLMEILQVLKYLTLTRRPDED